MSVWAEKKLYREEMGKAGRKLVYEQIKGLVITKRLQTPALSHMKRYCCALKSFSSLLEIFLSNSTFCKIKSKYMVEKSPRRPPFWQTPPSTTFLFCLKGCFHQIWIHPCTTFLFCPQYGWFRSNMDPVLFTEIQFNWELNLRSGSNTATERGCSSQCKYFKQKSMTAWISSIG